jgi:hypothetical protein
MLKEHELHSHVVARPQFSIVGRIQVKERAALSRDTAFESTAMHCLDPFLGARGGAIGISAAQGSIAEYAKEGINSVLML